jgi:hypothetical protein
VIHRLLEPYRRSTASGGGSKPAEMAMNKYS